MAHRLLLALLVGAFAALATGCKGNCQQLSEKLCNCALSTPDQASCLQRVSSAVSTIGTNSQQEAYCGTLLNRCDCHTIKTPAGKVACGMARAYPDGGVP